MHCLSRSLLLITLASLSGLASAGDTLLIDRAKQTPANAPSHGMSAAQVTSRFGAPASKLEPRGGQKRAWPTITRWVYPTYTVYFAHDRVIDVVANQASADEIGPKPAVK
ncbi:MAG TPA: hypothetical protein PK789_00850 [Thermomonas sp.]|uniref:hypothetical protein n=1 Tax=Thermomonas sp. TaxID=1971895 RepID=UPI002B6046C1|nr:hypothetical protein [Thermomonas sp.]HOV95317.1 hypothetical protein [Thermomonas sp.]